MPKNKSMVTDSFITHERIIGKIYLIRGRKVMLDRDLAELYGVLTKALNQAVKRNALRFPDDFMFQLTKQETENWKSQIVTSNKERMGIRKMPIAFTDLGIAMLSSVLRSKTAILVNIQIMRTFSKIREMLASNEMLRQKIEQLERRSNTHDEQIKAIFDAMKKILEPRPVPPKKPIGFHAERGENS